MAVVPMADYKWHDMSFRHKNHGHKSFILLFFRWSSLRRPTAALLSQKWTHTLGASANSRVVQVKATMIMWSIPVMCHKTLLSSLPRDNFHQRTKHFSRGVCVSRSMLDAVKAQRTLAGNGTQIGARGLTYTQLENWCSWCHSCTEDRNTPRWTFSQQVCDLIGGNDFPTTSHSTSPSEVIVSMTDYRQLTDTFAKDCNYVTAICRLIPQCLILLHQAKVAKSVGHPRALDVSGCSVQNRQAWCFRPDFRCVDLAVGKGFRALDLGHVCNSVSRCVTWCTKVTRSVIWTISRWLQFPMVVMREDIYVLYDEVFTVSCYKLLLCGFL